MRSEIVSRVTPEPLLPGIADCGGVCFERRN